MGFGAICDLVALAGAQSEGPPIFEFCLKTSLQNQQNVPLPAPVVRQVARRVFDHSNTDAAELSCSPVRFPAFAWVNFWCD